MSSDWKATIDTDELLKTGNPEAKMEKLEEKIKGFLVKIQSPYFLDSFNASIIEERIKKGGEVQTLDVYFNNYLIPKIDLHEKARNCGKFNKYFSTNFFKATLAIAAYDSPSLYYEKRFVENLYNFSGLSGVVEMRKNALTLQEPDRKNYIWDSKAKNFEKRLQEARKELYLDFMKEATEEEINEYAGTIENYLDVEDYEKLILIDGEKLELSVEESDVDVSNPNIKWIATNEMLDLGEKTEEITSETIKNFNSLSMGGRVYKKIDIEDNEEILTRNVLSIKKKPKKEKKSLKQAIRETTRKVWVKANQIEEHKDLIAKAEYYGVRVFIAKNILQEKVFEHNQVSYIPAIKSGIQKKNFIKDICIKTNKEKYFLELLQPILQYYELPANTFKIGHLKMYIETTLDGVVINREIIRNIKDKIRIYGVTDGDNIVLDRRAIGLQRFNLTGNGVGVHELKALMANIKTISHELAHLIYGTEDNTKEHFEAENRIYEEIVNLYLTF